MVKRSSARKRGGLRVVIFDYGGTLFKSTQPWAEVRAEGLAAAYGYLERAGLQLPFERFTAVCDSVFEEYAKLEAEEDRDIADRVKYKEIVGRLFPDSTEAGRTKLASGANRAFWDVATKSYPLRPSAKRALAHLKAKGLRMAIVSNHHDYDSLVSHLADSGIHSHFEVVLASEKEGVRKPNKEIFARSLEAMRAKSHEALFVGDSPKHDIAGARASGIKAVLIDDGSPGDGRTTPVVVSPSDEKPDYVIEDLLELREIVDSLVKKGASPRRRG